MKLNQHEFKVEKMANILGVSRGGYYKFVEGKRSVHQERDFYLVKRITSLFEESRQTYGSPRIHAVLKTEGEKVGLKRVARLMRESKLVARKRQRFKLTTKVDKRLPVAENLLQRDFKAQRPN